MWNVVLLLSIIACANLVTAAEEPSVGASHIPYTATSVGENKVDPSTVKPPDFSRHRAVSALASPPVAYNPQPYVMNPKPQDLHASSSADYAYAHPGGSNGYEYYMPPTVYDHHLQHGSEHMYHMEDESHHHEDRQVGATARDIALGFLTFLIVLSTLQGATLNLMRNPNIVSIMPAGRRRRDVQQLPIKEIPEMTPFIKIPEEDSRDNHVKYAQQNICATASNIAGLLGLSGSRFARYISELVSRSDSNGWTRLVADAGSAGLAGVDCGSLYQHKDTYNEYM